MDGTTMQGAAAPLGTVLENLGRWLVVNVRGVGEVRLDLAELLRIDPNNVMAALADHPTRLAYLGQVVEGLRESHTKAHRERKTKEAFLRGHYTVALEGQSKKATVAAVDAEIEKDAGYQQSQDMEDAYESGLKRAEHAYWALQSRKDILLEIARRQAAEAGGSRPVYGLPGPQAPGPSMGTPRF